MVDFSTPNLCGASPEFNKLMSQFNDIKKLLFDNLEADAGDLATLLDVDMDVLDVDLRSLVTALKTLKALNLQSEITALLGMSPASSAYINKLADIAGKFGTGLSAGGYSLDSLVSGAVSDLASGLDLCGNVPNFELPTGAAAAVEKAKAVLQATTEPEKETKSIATVSLNSAVSIAKTAAAAKAALYASSPSSSEGGLSGAFKTATKTEAITFATGAVDAVTYKNAVTVGTLDQAKSQKVPQTRSNYSSKGLVERKGKMKESFDSAEGTLTHQPTSVGNVWAVSPDYPSPTSKYAGIHREEVNNIIVAKYLTQRRYKKFFESNGKNIKIIDRDGNAVGGITKMEVNYSYLSNYDPRFKVE